VTIAAGFRCLDGVLIGADSRLESGDVKYDEDKTFVIPSKHSHFEAIVTGSGDFEAIQHCVYLLDTNFFKDCDGSLSAIAGEIRRFSDSKAYRKLVDRLEAHLKPDLLIGLRSHQGETDLLHLFDYKLHRVREYIAVGAGHSTGMFFSKWLYRPELDIEAFAPIAAQIFRAAKGTHVGCEGNTTLHRLYNAGKDDAMVAPCAPLRDEKLLWGLHDMLPSLLFCCADNRLSEDHFEQCLSRFVALAREVRGAIAKSKATVSSPAVPIQSDPGPTTRGCTGPQSLRGSPGGRGES